MIQGQRNLAYINFHACNLHTPHPVWKVGTADHLTVMKAITKVKLLTQRHLLYYSRTAGVHYSHNCPLCGAALETLAHFQLACPVLSSVRQPHLLKLQAAIVDCFHPPNTDEELVGTILDPPDRKTHTPLG